MLVLIFSHCRFHIRCVQCLTTHSVDSDEWAAPLEISNLSWIKCLSIMEFYGFQWEHRSNIDFDGNRIMAITFIISIIPNGFALNESISGANSFAISWSLFMRMVWFKCLSRAHHPNLLSASNLIRYSKDLSGKSMKSQVKLHFCQQLSSTAYSSLGIVHVRGCVNPRNYYVSNVAQTEM